MFIELVEVLRCIREHDESWLVAAIDVQRERSIRKGTLGCPVCGAEYPISDGVAEFSAMAARAEEPPASGETAAETAMRAGGFLGLADATGVVVLGGSWCIGATALSEGTNVRVIAANAPRGVDESASVALVGIADIIPVGAGSCAGIALDGSFNAAAISSAQRAVRAGGRMVGPKAIRPPEGWTVLAEDGSWWVGQKPPEVTTLRRGNR